MRWWHKFKFPIVLIVSVVNAICALGALYLKIVPIPIVYVITFCNAILLLGLVVWLEENPRQSDGGSGQSPQEDYNYELNKGINCHKRQKSIQCNKPKMGKNDTDNEGSKTYNCQYLHGNFNVLHHNAPPKGKP